MIETVDAEIKSISLLTKSKLIAPTDLKIRSFIKDRSTSTTQKRFRCFCSVSPDHSVRIDDKHTPMYKNVRNDVKDPYCDFTISINLPGRYTIYVGGNFYNKKSIEIEVS